MNLRLIIGIGNKGEIYRNTYHNVGILAVDALKRMTAENGMPPSAPLEKTDGFMNESGRAVQRIMKRHRVTDPSSLLIIHDDSDLPFGTYKFSLNRGSAGHKGVEDIIRALGTKNFWRLRIGIRPHEKNAAGVVRRAKAGAFVLKRMPEKDVTLIAGIIADAFSKIPTTKTRT